MSEADLQILSRLALLQQEAKLLSRGSASSLAIACGPLIPDAVLYAYFDFKRGGCMIFVGWSRKGMDADSKLS